MKTVIFINSHPIQYFAPMYKFMNEQGVETKAWYCTKASLAGGYDKEFGTKVKWDIPLLDGYESLFFKNSGKYESGQRGFFSIINWGMVRELFRTPKSVIVVHGWNYLTHFLIIMLGKLAGHTVCIRNDIPQSHEVLKTGWKQKIKKVGLRYFLFPRINYFLYIGKQNHAFYRSYDIPESKLVYIPYAVDNSRFYDEYNKLKYSVANLRRELGINNTDKVIMYSGKYIAKKRPFDLLKAFALLNKPNCWLVMVGEGELRKGMEEYIEESGLQNVILTGFVNQSQIANYYAMSDAFVMCSSNGENWGLSVNEAMNFNLPLIISDLTGCSIDLVETGENGYIFQTGNVADLSEKIDAVLYQNKLNWHTTSIDVVNQYSYETITNNIKAIL